MSKTSYRSALGLFLVAAFVLLLSVMLAAQDLGIVQYEFWGTRCEAFIDLQAFESAAEVRLTVKSGGEFVAETSVSGNDVARLTLPSGVRPYTIYVEYEVPDEYKYTYKITMGCENPNEIYDWYQYQADLIPPHSELDYIDAELLRALEQELGHNGLVEYLIEIHDSYLYYYGPNADSNYATLASYRLENYGARPTTAYDIELTSRANDYIYQTPQPEVDNEFNLVTATPAPVDTEMAPEASATEEPTAEQ